MNMEIGEWERMSCNSTVGSLVKELKDFESRLSENQELYISTKSEVFRLEKLRHDYNTIVMYGSTQDGMTLVKVLHHLQLDVSFFALEKRKPDEPARRIGFAVD